ncbi:hypothetical protein TSO221_14940 [Azospirillum sp. TSO22-1]|nr:hypothetical protein TSO221_14940 [Azospirillum sp. TSO22-1]
MFDMSDDQKSRRRMPDYRAMARHLASLSAEAAEMARRNGDPRFAALAERLKTCSDQIRTDTAKR